MPKVAHPALVDASSLQLLKAKDPQEKKLTSAYLPTKSFHFLNWYEYNVLNIKENIKNIFKSYWKSV